ncbi:hypothetical protein FRC17_000441 [Serendipita sp. 399]|nr:hypothetical protein FRC17_000441 [Serendipita sp. 399]
MFKTLLFIGLCLLSFQSVLAYMITTPSDRDGMEGVAWTTNGPNNIVWERVSTDPERVTVVLVNENRSVLPTNNLLLAEDVDGTLLHIAISASAGTAFPPGNGFRVNFVKSKNDVNTIYAQSSQFRIVEGGGAATSAGHGSSSSTDSNQFTVQDDSPHSTQSPRTTYVAPAETVTVTAAANSAVSSKVGLPLLGVLGMFITSSIMFPMA